MVLTSFFSSSSSVRMMAPFSMPSLTEDMMLSVRSSWADPEPNALNRRPLECRSKGGNYFFYSSIINKYFCCLYVLRAYIRINSIYTCRRSNFLKQSWMPIKIYFMSIPYPNILSRLLLDFLRRRVEPVDGSLHGRVLNDRFLPTLEVTPDMVEGQEE